MQRKVRIKKHGDPPHSVTAEEDGRRASRVMQRLKDVPISMLFDGALDTSTSQGVVDEFNRVPGVVITPKLRNRRYAVTKACASSKKQNNNSLGPAALNRPTRIGILLFTTSALALAQQPALRPIVEKSVVLNLASQPLEDALREFSRATGLKVMLYAELGRGIASPRVSGILNPGTALEMLLKGAALRFEYLDAQTIAVLLVHDQSSDAISRPMSRTESDGIRTASATESVGESDTRTLHYAGNDRAPPADHEPDNRPKSNLQNELEEILVTAQKREERLQDVPISISVLSGDALDRSTVQSVSDELNRVPGVVIPPPSQFGVTQIAVRGVAASGLQWNGASPVAYYLDTVPFGFVRSAYIPDSGTFDLARVEVLRGPQGTLYGANAEDGVARTIPNQADVNQFDMKARALGSATDYGGGVNWGGDLAVNVPLIDGKLAVRGVIGYQDWSGWIDRPTEKDANDALLRNYRLKLAYQPTDAISIDLSLWSSRDHFGAPPNSLPNHTAQNTGTTAEPTENDFDAYGAKINYQFAHFSITSMTSYLDFSSYNELDLTPYGGPFFSGLNVHNWLRSRVVSEELLLNSTDTDPWRWTTGAFYRDERDVNDQVVVPGDLAIIDFNDTSRSYALFGQVSRRFLNDKFEWTLGVRQFHDDVSTLSTDPTVVPPSYVAQSFNATTPRAVLSWYPSTNVTVYSSVSEGFRSGMPQYYTITQIAPGITAVKPDKLYNYEVGTKVDMLNHHLAIDTAIYYVDWRDVQQSILLYLPVGGQTPAQINGSGASGSGVDLAVTVRPNERLQFGGTFSWNDLTLDSNVISAGQILFSKGDRLNNSSEYTGSVFANYTFLLGAGGVSGELSASGNYTSKQATRGIGGTGLAYVSYGDSLLFASAAFTVTFPRNWSIKLYGDNVTNEYGTLYGTQLGYGPNAEQFDARPRPRTIGLEVDYRFR